MKQIIALFKIGLVSLEDANGLLRKRGYELRDTYQEGNYFLYPYQL